MGDFFSPEPTEQQTTQSGTSSGTFDTTSASTLTPWEPATSGLADIAGQAAGLAGTNQQFFPGGTFIPQTQQQMDILQQQFGAAGGFGGQFVDPAVDAWQQQLQGPGRGAFSNALDVYGADIGRQFERNILPGISDQFVGAGGRRSSRAGIAEGLAAGEATDAIARYGAGLELDFQRLGSQQQQFALGAAPGMMNLSMMPGQTQYGIQNQMQLDPRRQLQEDMSRFDFEQGPGQWGNLYNAFNLLSPMGSTFGTQTGDVSGTQTGMTSGTSSSITSGGGPSPFAQIAGAGLTAAGLASGNPMAAMGGGASPAYSASTLPFNDPNFMNIDSFGFGGLG